jgi:hypothetical protein
MKRFITLVCLFAVFSVGFASNGSFDQGVEDVKQENVVTLCTTIDFPTVLVPTVDVAEFAIKNQWIAFNQNFYVTEISNKKIAAVPPDILSQPNKISYINKNLLPQKLKQKDVIDVSKNLPISHSYRIRCLEVIRC